MRAVVAALALALALPVQAQEPAEFRAHAPITITGPAAFQMLALPREAFTLARPDLADVRIFNGRGEPVPMAWAGAPPAKPEAAPPIGLPIFPVAAVAAAAPAGAEVTIRAADGTLVSLRGAAKAAAPKARAPVAYLIDASATTEPVVALFLDWKSQAGTEVVPVRLEASEDLRTWATVAASPLVRVQSEGRELTQPRIEFPPRRVKYLRLTATGAPLEVASARAEFEPRGRAAPRKKLVVEPGPETSGMNYVYDLGGRLPVEAFHVVPREPNSVVSAVVATREASGDQWRTVANVTSYRLVHEGAEISPPPVQFGRVSSRYWMVRVNKGSSKGAPSLEVEWRPAEIAFVPQGEGPFTLAFGNSTAKRTALSPTELIPANTKVTMREAMVGEVKAGPPPTRFETLVASANPRRMALWAILVGGVLLLGWMAMRMLRKG